MGGQVGDTGWLIADDEKIDVIDTKRENNLPVHLVAKLPKDVTATFTAKINEKSVSSVSVTTLPRTFCMRRCVRY